MTQPVNAFIAAVKEKRNEVRAQYEVDLVEAFDAGGKPDWHGLAAKAIDQAITSVLDLVIERVEDIVDVKVFNTVTDTLCSVKINQDLSTMYFEEVST
jgi:hypothetical protein